MAGTRCSRRRVTVPGRGTGKTGSQNAKSAAGGMVGADYGCRVVRFWGSSLERDGLLLLPNGLPQQTFNAPEERVDGSLIKRGDRTASKSN